MEDRNKNKRLDFCNFKLDTLLEITNMINETLPTETLLHKYRNLLLQRLAIGKIIIFAHNKGWEMVLQEGFGQEGPPPIDVEADLMPFDSITTVTAANLSHLAAMDTLIPVFHHDKPLAFVLIGDVDEERQGVSPTIKHLRFIQTLTNLVIQALENKRLQQESLRQEVIKKELELASRMQSMLIPDSWNFPKNDQIFVEAFYLPHLDVGGDYYDFFALSDHEYAFCMSDVSGKGISAAILMSNFQANMRALFTDEIELPELVQKLNARVMASANGEKFITLFVGKYNLRTRELNYINAGHNPPFCYDKDSGQMSYLSIGCPGMGMLDELPVVREGRVMLSAPTKILCYTDGLVELRGENTTDAGMSAVAAILSDDKRVDASIEAVIQELDVSRQNKLFFDDISLLGIDIF